jgi:hypothetical protein
MESFTGTGEDGRGIDTGKGTNDGGREDARNGVKKEEGKEEKKGAGSIEREEGAINK